MMGEGVKESISVKSDKPNSEDKEVAITFDTLFEILRREKSRDELQKLNDSFFEDIIKYLEGKYDIIKNQQNMLFATEEREKTLIQIQNIKKMIRELYDRREKKIINMALNKARTESNIIDTSALMKEERHIFESLFYVLNSFRRNILENIIEAKQPCIAPLLLKREAEKEGGNVSVNEPVSELGDSSKSMTALDEEKEGSDSIFSHIEKGQALNISDEELQKKESVLKDTSEIKSIKEESKIEYNEDSARSSAKKLKVRFLSDLPSFIGPSLEVYGPYEENETATIPEEIAKLLAEKGRAELIEDE